MAALSPPDPTPPRPTWWRDAAIAAGVTVAAGALFVATDAYEWLHELLKGSEAAELDEIFLTLPVAFVMAIWFGWRRQSDAAAVSRRRDQLLAVLDAAYKQSPDAISLTDGRLNTVLVNDRYFEYFGLDPVAARASGDITLYSLRELARRGEYGPGDPDELAAHRQAAVRRAMQDEGSLTYERQMRDGRWMEARISNLDGVGWLTVYRDFTDRKRAEVELAHFRDRLSAVLNSTREGFWFVAGDGRTSEVNPGMARLLGRPAVEVLGRPVDDFLDAANAAALRDGLAASRQGAPAPFEIDLRRPDGTSVPCLVAPTPLPPSLGGPDGTGWVGIWTDISERRQAEAALATSEARLREAQRIARLGSWSVDLETGKLAWADGMVNAFGHWFGDSDDPRRSFLEQVIHPDDLPRVLSVHDAAVATGTRHSGDVRFRRPDGSVGWLHMEGQAVYDPAGRPLELRGTAQDVTEAKQAELALRELNENLEQRATERAAALVAQERRYHAVLDRVADIVLIVGPDARVAYVSPAARTVLGLEPDAMVGNHLLDYIHPDDRTGAVDALQRGLAKPGSSVDLDIRARHADGRWRTMAVNGRSLVDDPAVAGVLITARDVTERRLAARALEQARADLNDALESISHGIALYDAEDRLILCNEVFREHNAHIADLLQPGISFEALVRAAVERGSRTLPPGIDLDAHVARRMREHRAPPAGGFQHRLPDGRVLHVLARRSHAGGIITVGQDITEQLQAERRLREAQRMEAVGKLTGGMAHDFNNFLTVVIGNLDLLAMSLDESRAQQQLIDTALAACRRAADLTQSLLAFSRQQPLDPRVQDPNERIASMARILHRTVGDDVAIQLNLAGDLWPVLIDGAQLESCILNLVNNARDAMPEGGTVTIGSRNVSLEPQEASTLPLDSAAGLPRAGGDFVLLEISDTGAGMPAEVVERAFEPFFTTKEVGRGTGLGLSMVYGFVKQSGGEVTLYSEPGHGTTVRLYLPRAAAVAARPAATAAPAALPQGSGTVLVVEDNDALRATVMAQIASLGYRTVEAATGDEALALLVAGDTAVDLVFSDVVMPGRVGGGELARRVAESWPTIPVLLTSGFAGATPATADLPAGVPMLHKPYLRRDLAQALRDVLERGSAATGA